MIMVLKTSLLFEKLYVEKNFISYNIHLFLDFDQQTIFSFFFQIYN